MGNNKLTNWLVVYGPSWTAVAYITDAEFNLIPIRNAENETYYETDKHTPPRHYSSYLRFSQRKRINFDSNRRMKLR